MILAGLGTQESFFMHGTNTEQILGELASIFSMNHLIRDLIYVVSSGVWLSGYFIFINSSPLPFPGLAPGGGGARALQKIINVKNF